MGSNLQDYARSQIEETVQTAQSLLNCRTLEEVGKIHKDFMQQSFDRLINETNKMAQKAASLAKETAEPLNAKLNSFVHRTKGNA